MAEDDDFVFVQLKKADNFYQLPVTVKEGKDISGGKEFLVDAFSAPRGHIWCVAMFR